MGIDCYSGVTVEVSTISNRVTVDFSIWTIRGPNEAPRILTLVLTVTDAEILARDLCRDIAPSYIRAATAVTFEFANRDERISISRALNSAVESIDNG